MLDQFWPRYTDAHVFAGVIHWGFGHWGSGAEVCSAMSHLLFAKDVMNEPAYIGMEMSASPPACIQEVEIFGSGSVMMWAAISYNNRTNLVCVLGNLTSKRYRDNILQPHMLNLIDRQRGMTKQDNAQSHTARVIIDFQLRTTLMYCHDPQSRLMWTP